MMVSYEDFFGGKKKETKMKLKDVIEDEAGLGNQVLYRLYLFLSNVICMISFLICETVHEI